MAKELGKYFVLDLTRGESGAVCAEYLALAGMDVIRVEQLRDTKMGRGDRAGYIVKNLNKKYITLDTDTAEGKEILSCLVSKADVIVENRDKAELLSLKTDYESVKAANSAVVYISISPYASGSPWENMPADRAVISAMSGATYQCGDYGCEPVEPGGDLPDVTSCVFAATAAAAALYKREDTGEGKYIEVSQMDSVIALGRGGFEKYYNKKANTRSGNMLLNCAPTGIYKTKDGEVSVMCLAEADFAPLCAAMGMPELADDARFKTQSDRVKNRAAIDEIVSAWTANYGKFEVMQKLLAEHRFICSAIYTIEDMANAEDLRSMGLIQKVCDEELGEMWLPAYTAVCNEFWPQAVSPEKVTAKELEKEGRYGL